PRPDTGGDHSEYERIRAGVERYRMAGADVVGDLALECLDLGPTDVHAARQDRFDARHQLRLFFAEMGPGGHVRGAPHSCDLKIDKIPRCYRRQTKADRATGIDARAT